MSLTAYNQYFGWVHTFKINRNNALFRPDASTQRPFPIIVDQPNTAQIFANWNSADTGLVLSSLAFAICISRYLVDKDVFEQSILRKRFHYRRYINLITFAGFVMGVRNSCNRLQGYVPNGLPKKRTEQVLKYDYTSEFLANTPWSNFYTGRSKPSTK